MSAATLLLSTGAALADSLSWSGAVSNDWFTPGNWTGAAHAPTSADDVRIDAPGVLLDGADGAAATVSVGKDAGAQGGLTIREGLTTTDATLGDSAGATGTITVTGSFGSWVNSGETLVGNSGTGTVRVLTASEFLGGVVHLGVGATGIGTLEVSNQSNFEASSLYVGSDGSGTFTLEQDATAETGRTIIADGAGSSGDVTIATDSTWTLTDALTIGGGGVGTLLIKEDADVTGTSAVIGDASGSDGSSVTVTGSGTSWINTGSLYVGNFGGSTLDILAGATVENGDAVIGRHSTASVTVSGSGSSWTTNALRIGGDRSDASSATPGDGTLDILAGATVNSSSAVLGDSTNSEGTVTVNGRGSLWDISGSLVVGGYGVGTLSITNGGVVNSVGGVIGDEATGSGTVTITGNDSLWDSSGSIYVGDFGDAALQLLAGGDLTSTNGYVGMQDGFESEVTVSGSGSTWTTSGTLYVGQNDRARGQVTISAGGTIDNAAGMLGNLAGSYGAMTVTGAGSLWDVSGDLNVGHLGEGHLTVALGGDVTAARSFIGNDNGSVGTATVSGNGSSWVTTGDLYVGKEGAGTLTIAGGGVVSADEIIIASESGSNGKLIVGADLGQTAGGTAGFSSRAIHFGDGDGSLIFNFGGADLSFASVIDGDGDISVANGKVIYSGNGSAFTGATDISGGTLQLANARLGGTLAVSGWGTLSGTGTIGETAIQSGATVTPGGTGVGRLDIDGNLSINAGATYRVDVNPQSGTSDRLHASGTASLTGGSVLVSGPSSGYGSSRSYVILSADGGLTGAFSTVSSSYSFLDPALSYGANDVTLNLTRNSTGFSEVAQTTNQSSTAGAIENLGAGNAVYEAVVVLDNNTAASAFQQLSGAVYSQGLSASLENTGLMRNLGGDRIRSSFGSAGAGRNGAIALGGTSGANTSGALAYGEEKMKTPAELAAESILAPPKPQGPVAWGEAYGGWGKSFGENGSADLSNSIGGVAFGIDTALADTTWRLGIMAGYGAAFFELSDGRSSGDSDDFDLGLYGGNQWGPLALRFGALYKHQRVSAERTVDIGSLTDQLSAEYGTNTVQAFAELGYELKVEDVRLEPFVNLAQVHMRTPSFTESGGASSLTRAASDTDITFTNLGLRAQTDLELSGNTVTLRGGASWQHAFGDTEASSSLSFAGGSDFVTSSKVVAENSLALQAGIDMPFGDQASVGVSFDGNYSNRGHAQTVKLNFQKQF